MTGWSLDRLVAPFGAEEFFTTYFEQRSLVARRDQADYFSSLLTLDDIDRILTTLEATDEDITVVDAARKIEHSDYVDGDDKINIDRLLRLHHAGATVILNHLEGRHPPLHALCAALELEFSAPFQTNIYLTPAGAQGFKAHFDTHDVFVLQVAGSKRWRLFDTPIELALKADGEDARQDDPGTVTDEFELKAGDTLYIPRGLVHDATSTDEASLHITVGNLAWTWSDFLIEAVADLAKGHRDARAALPPGFARPGFDRVRARDAMRVLADKLADAAATDRVLDRFVNRFIDERRPFLRGQMDALKHIDTIGLDADIEPRPYLAYHLDEAEDAARLRFHGGELALPLHAGAALRFALETPRYKVRDLPDSLDDAGKIVLIRRLIREGLVHNAAEPQAKTGQPARKPRRS